MCKKILKIKIFIILKNNSKNKGTSQISEIKKASPFRFNYSENFNHLDIAKMYVENGAT